MDAIYMGSGGGKTKDGGGEEREKEFWVQFWVHYLTPSTYNTALLYMFSSSEFDRFSVCFIIREEIDILFL